ncbi:hypothetical protein D3C87_1971030 [compost metagenome]
MPYPDRNTDDVGVQWRVVRPEIAVDKPAAFRRFSLIEKEWNIAARFFVDDEEYADPGNEAEQQKTQP